MIVITAPDETTRPTNLSVFLAGGITNCPDWQDELIDILADMGFKYTVYNPRRENFPIHDPNAARQQIAWEFDKLNHCTVFSMWFCNSESVQPICMYELGRHLAIRKINEVVIGVEPGYSREQDVAIQSELALGSNRKIYHSLEDYASAINNLCTCIEMKRLKVK